MRNDNQRRILKSFSCIALDESIGRYIDSGDHFVEHHDFEAGNDSTNEAEKLMLTLRKVEAAFRDARRE